MQLFNKGGLLVIVGMLLLFPQCGKKETVYGKIGSRKITKTTLDEAQKYLTKVNPMSRSQYEGDEGQQKLIQDYIENEVMYRDGVKKGLNRDSAIVQELDTYRFYLVLRKYEQEELEAKAGIPEKDFKGYYDQHLDDYQVKAKVLVKHILCDQESLARQVLKEIKEGQEFDDLVETWSLDEQTNKSQGRLGWVTEGAAIPYLGKLPEFNAALFRLKKGAVSEPIKTEKGYHIVKVEDTQPATVKTLDEVRAQIRDNLLATEEALKKYYEEHKEEFGEPEERKVRHILVNDEKTARQVLARLKKGARFEKLVKQYSQCSGTKGSGGEIGLIRQGRYIPNVGNEPAFETAVFAVAGPGEFAEVVKTGRGYHVIQVTEIKPAKEKTFEEAKYSVRTKLLEVRKKEGREKMLKALEEQYRVQRETDLKDKPVFGKIGSKKITQADLDKSFSYLSKVDRTARETYEGDDHKAALLDKHIEMESMYQDGLRQGYQQDEFIAGELGMYERYLVLRDYQRKELEAKAGLSDREIKKYYREHKEEFRITARALVKQIVCASSADAQAVLQQLKQGAVFDSLVATASIDSQTNKSQGSLGWVTEDGPIPYYGNKPELNAAIFQVKEGAVGPPVQTDQGYHLLKVEKLIPGRYKDLEEVVTQIRDQLLVTDEDIQKYYEAHRDEYLEKEQRKVSHIQLGSESKAQQVLAKLKKGTDFAALAKRYSEDKSTAGNGGSLSYIRRDSYIRSVGREPAFENAAFGLARAGDYSEVVKTAKGYHVIQLNEIKSERQKPLAEVKSLIQSRVLADQKAAGIKHAKEDLKKRYRVKVYEIQRTEKELFDLAQKALEDKKYEKAIQYYQRITTDYPKSERAYQAIFLVGWVYSEYLKDYDNADKYFKTVLEKYPNSDLADDADWMIKNQRDPNALDFIIKKAEEQARQDSLKALDSAKVKGPKAAI